MTRGDAHRVVFAGTGEEALQSRIPTRRHFAKVGDALKGGAGITQFFQDLVFHVVGDNTSVGAATVENASGHGFETEGKGMER